MPGDTYAQFVSDFARSTGIGTVGIMPARRVEITIPEKMWQEIDVARGEEPRASWIKRALRAELDRRDGRVNVAEIIAEIQRLADRATDTGTDTV